MSDNLSAWVRKLWAKPLKLGPERNSARRNVSRFAEGNFEAKIERFPGKSRQYFSGPTSENLSTVYAPFCSAGLHVPLLSRHWPGGFLHTAGPYFLHPSGNHSFQLFHPGFWAQVEPATQGEAEGAETDLKRHCGLRNQILPPGQSGLRP